MKVYVAAPFGDGARARSFSSALHVRSIETVSTWAETASGAEQLSDLALGHVRALASANDRELESAHVLVALPRERAGGEMFAEVRRALDLDIPVVWVGKRTILSAYRPGAIRVLGEYDAINLLTTFAQFLQRPWPIDDMWARILLRELIEQLEVRDDNEESCPATERSVGGAA